MRFRPWLQALAIASAIAIVIVIAWSADPSITSVEGQTPATPPDKPTEFASEKGDQKVRLSWNNPAPGSPSITDYQLWQLAESERLTARDRTKEDEFGYSVAVEGDTAAIGVPGDDHEEDHSGSVFVYTRDQTTSEWNYTARLTAYDPEVNAKLGLSVALHGNTIVAGAPKTDDDEGAAYVFTKPETGGWVSTSTSAKLVASTSTKEFGWSVAVDGDTVVVGARYDNQNTGSVYVFTKPQTDWVSTSTAAVLTAPGRQGGDEFGNSVEVEGGTIAVGAHRDDGTKGSAFVFTRPVGGWVSTSTAAKLTLSQNERRNLDFFGSSVALDRNTVVIGAPGGSGAAYVFLMPDTGGWVSSTSTAAKLTGSDAGNGDLFGGSVALDDDTIVVGANGDDNKRGSAYVFTKSDSGWATSTEAGKLIGSETDGEDDFGSSVSVHGTTVVVGAPDENNGGNERGAAYVFEIQDWTVISTEVGATTTSHLVTGLTNGWGYSFRVRAANSHGPGVPSDPAEATPTDQAPQPTDFSADLTGFGEVTLRWKAGSELLTVTGYRFTQDGGTNWPDIVGSSSSTVSHVVSGLDQRSYTFSVRAVNVVVDDDNASHPSTSQEVDVYVQPDAPTGLTADPGDTDVTLTWVDPDNSSIQKYQYWQAVNGGVFGSWIDIDGSGTSTTSHLVSGLTNGASYIFGVRSDTEFGEGLESISKSVTPRLAMPTGLSAEGGDTQVRLTWHESADTSIRGYQVLQHAEIERLAAADRSEYDEFGYSVAVEGHTAAIGVPGDDTPDNSGAVYVYTRDSEGMWAHTATLTTFHDDVQREEDRLGLSVALQGNTIVAGAAKADSDKGAAYVFTRPDDGWVSTSTSAKLVASATTTEFGWSVAVDDGTVVVGAHKENDDRGAVYVFTRPGTGWAYNATSTETARLTASGRQGDDRFGRSVAVEDGTIVVGADGDDGNQGSAFVFTKPGGDGGWVSTSTAAKLTLPQDKRNGRDLFGSSVALDGNTIVVGAKGDNGVLQMDSGRRGAAYVFLKTEDDWVSSTSTVAKLTGSDVGNGDLFGSSVALDGDTIVVGAREDDEAGSTSGSAFVFTKSDSGWTTSTETAKLIGSETGSDDLFGYSVALDGDIILIGAKDEDDGGTEYGAAYVFDVRDWTDTNSERGDTATSHIARRLTNKVEYTFWVRAMNGGPGARSDPVTSTPTAATSTPAKPRNFSAAQTGVDEVLLEWGVSAHPLTVTGHQYKQDDSDWRNISGSDSGTVSHVVSGLTKGATYTFAVRAVNSFGGFGASDSSDPRSVTVLGLPAAPTGLYAAAGDSQVLLSWVGPDDSSIEKFQFRQTEDGDWNDIDGSVATTTLVTDLNNGTQYTFRVRAVNPAGEGAASDAVTLTPAGTGSAPGIPANFAAAQTGVDQVELTWDKAPQPRTVTGYQFIQDNISSDDDVPAWTPISDSDSNTVSYTVSDLREPDPDPNTYTFAVRAINSYGVRASRSISVTIVAKPKRPTGVSATGGDTQATVQWRVPSVIKDHPIDEHQLLQIPLSTLTADDRAANDEFGYSVAIDGNTAVVGAYHRSLDGNTNVGVAYVFTKDSNDAWSQAATLTASDGAANDEFGISVAIDGNTIVVGARQDDTRNGAAYVFTRPDGGWTSTTTAAKLTASDGEEDDRFGHSVAVVGDTLVVGAYGDDGNRGAAYVFTKTGAAWISTTTAAKLIASDVAANDELGISVAIDGDTVVVGAHQPPYEEGGEIKEVGPGASYVFTKPTGGWADNTEGAKFTAPDGAAKDQFGISVAIDGNTVVIGAHQPSYKDEDDETVDVGPGAAYVFTRDSNSGKWGQPVKLTASNGVLGDGFGKSVAVDGNTAAVGAYLFDRADGVAPGFGSAYVFARDPNSGKWSQTHNLTAPGSASHVWFGHSVAVSNDTVLAGVPQDDGSRGSAYAMDISTAEWVDFVSTELTMSDDEYYVYRVLGLTNDQEYAFRVRSVNAAGNHPSAETVSATPKLGRPVKPTGLVAEARDRAVELSWDLSDDSTISSYQVLQRPEQSRLTASDGADSDRFGSAVAVDGGTAVVGAPQDDDNGVNSGSAYVFTRDPLSGEWSQPIKLTASDGDTSDEFGYSVAVHGDTIVVGARQLDYQSGGQIVSRPGAAYVFTRPDGGWVATSTAAKLTDSDGKENDWFGYSVAVHESTIVVGARGYDGKKGAAYVFTKSDGGEWTSTSTAAKLTASDGAGSDYFGHSVAVHGGTIVTGAYRHKANGISNTGAAYVFIRPVGGWVATSTAAKLSASNGDDGDQFGRSVAVDGDTVVIGAQEDDGYRGSAYVFTDAIEMAKLTASDRGANDYFGSSVAVRGGTIVIGAPSANIDVCDDIDDCDEDPRSGAAYVFTKPAGAFWANDPNEDNRKESGKLTLPIEEGDVEKDDEFGNSVALDGQSIVVGAPADNDGFGSVYVSDFPVVWTDIDDSTATTVSHRVTDLENDVVYTFQVRAVDKVSDVGESPPSNIARATPLVRNHSPEFIDGESVTLSVDERESPGNDVGRAVTATDPDVDDTLVYSLSGTHASSFEIEASNGQIVVGSGTTLDYESGRREYSIIVSVNDRLNTDGDQDTTNDDSIDVTINVNNVDEDGTVSMSTTRPREGAALTASLTDPDGSVSNTSWQWARSANGSTGWRDIVRANSNRYRPVANDVGNYLRATVTYTDGHDSGKSKAAISANRVASEPTRRETSPPPTPTPVPTVGSGMQAASPTPLPNIQVGDATVPPGLLLVIGLTGMLLVIAGSIVVRERRPNSLR